MINCSHWMGNVLWLKSQAVMESLISKVFCFFLLEWPDYTSSESDSESEVEPIVGGTHDTDSATPTEEINQPMLTDTPSPDQSLNTEDTDMNIHKENHAHGTKHMHRTLPEEDQTAHRILHLLSEIGHSNLVEKPPFTERNFLPCKFCQGPIHIV